MENYSLNSKDIKQAATELINDNATYLIQYIYKQAGILNVVESKETPDTSKIPVIVQEDKSLTNTQKNSIFQNIEVRIGLSIRILAKTNRYYDEDLINLILDDIEYLRKESDYLLSFKDPKARKAALDEEYALIQGYIDMDDTISLNQDADTVSRVGKLASDGQCTIQ